MNKTGTLKVGIREFRDKLATYVVESDAPMAITRHGDTVGFYIPVRPKRTDADRAALHDAVEKWRKVLADAGVTEDEVVADFKALRKARSGR
jgi:hypothetical protein